MGEKSILVSMLGVLGITSKVRHEDFITPDITSLKDLSPERRLAIRKINKHFSDALRHIEIVNNITGAEKELMNCYDISKKYELNKLLPGTHSTFIVLLAACILEDVVNKAYNKEKYDNFERSVSDALHLVMIGIDELKIYHRTHEVEVSNVFSVYLMLYSIISAYKGDYVIALDYAKKSHDVDSSNELAEEIVIAIRETQKIKPKLIKALQKDLSKADEDYFNDIREYCDEICFSIFDEELRGFDIKLNNDRFLLNRYKGESKSHTHFTMNYLENKKNWRITMLVLERSIKVLTKVAANEISYLNKLEAISNIPEPHSELRNAA